LERAKQVNMSAQKREIFEKFMQERSGARWDRSYDADIDRTYQRVLDRALADNPNWIVTYALSDEPEEAD
jgi:hypothetical protein